MWRQLIDHKYGTDKPNIFYSNSTGSSSFFKCMIWAAKAAKMGYRWKIGNGKKVKFWEDIWLGCSSLAIQFWEIYVLVNEQSHTVYDLWDGVDLKCTFRREVDDRLMQLWHEILQLASTIVFSNEEGSLIWTFNSSCIYSSQSLYKVINFRGVKPVIPSRVHFLLLLLSKNKVLTRDNLGKEEIR